MSSPDLHRVRARRRMTVVLVVATTVSVAGYLTGTARSPTRRGYGEHAVETADAVADRAPRQADVGLARYAAQRARILRELEAMSAPPRSLADRLVVTPAERAAIVAARAERRAYDGAPPTVPHPVDQRGAPACLSCHENGMRVRDRIAPVMSHTAYASCLQCHAPTRALPTHEPPPASVATTSRFVGRASAGAGVRAQPGAPPQIPHATFMRERCESCHGVWASGLAGSHPSRQSCTQCHAPSSVLDQRPRHDLGPIGWVGGAP